MAKKLYIIDGHAHIYAAYYAPMRQQLTSPSGEPTKATYIFTTALLSLISNQQPDMLVVTMDSKEPSFRKKIYPEYKANRSPMPDDMPVQISRIEQILEALKIPVLRIEGYEADDIIGTLSTEAAKKNINSYICSKDKDMLQLLDKNVCTYDIKTGKKTTVESMAAEMQLSPDQFLDVLALAGDTADNVPGVPDVGPKTAMGWIQKYGSIENLYAHADEIKGKRGQSLRDSKDQAFLSRELVTINRKSPVELDYKAFELKEPNKKRLAEIFTELGFARLAKQLELPATEVSQNVPDETATVATQPGEPNSIKTVAHEYQLVDSAESFNKFLSELKKQKLFAVDTETTAINPMRAELVGMSFSWQAHKAYYLPVKLSLGQKHLDINVVRKKLGPILADENIKKVGQNIKYDLLVLRNAGMPVKGVYFDTMVASYCLDAARRSHSMDNMALDFLNYECVPLSSLIGKGKNQLTFDMVDIEPAYQYAAEDADITLLLYEYLKTRLDKQDDIKRLFEEVEMPLVTVLAEMEYNGVSLDVKLLKKMSHELSETIDSLTDRIHEQAGTAFNIDSPKQLAEILFGRLQIEPVRITKTGPSTDAGVLEQLAAQHPIAELILEYRTMSKLQNTYVNKLGSLINLKTNRVHASFNQTITATGRLSSSGPNLQNIPIRTDIGRKIRSAFIPKSKSDCILSADYSQIELRLLAHFSKDEALRDAFAADQDIHSFVASQIYGVSIEEVTSEMRSSCKAVNFGIIYGQGAFGLSRGIGISIQQAKEFIDDYFERYASIREFMDSVTARAKEKGYAETILHRRRNIPNLSSSNMNKRSQAERMAVNTVIQGSAADLIKVAMINIQRKIDTENLPVKLILQIHDELVFELPSNQAKKHAKWIAEEMTTAIKLNVSLKVDISYGPTWLSEK